MVETIWVKREWAESANFQSIIDRKIICVANLHDYQSETI